MEEYQLQQLWEQVLEIIEQKISKPSFETWLKSTKAIATNGKAIIIQVPNEFAKDWLQTQYASLIKETLKTVTNEDKEIGFSISNQKKEKSNDFKSKDFHEKTLNQSPQRAVPSMLNQKYTFDTFVIGNGNRFAHAASLAVAEAPAQAYNPLFIYGGVGLGKTHLMHAIGHFIIEQNPSSQVVYVSSEKFTNELINSIRDDKTVQFRNRYRNIDVLMVDDIQFLAGKERTQEEFFHTFNALHDAAKQIIISSDRPPKEIPTLEDRLRSRFEWGLIADIQPPDLETRIAILRKKATMENLSVPNEVMSYIAAKIVSNIRELEGALIRVVAYSSLINHEITLELANKALKDIIPSNKPKQISIENIQQVVAKYFNIKIPDLKSKKRTRTITYPRQIAMYICRELTDASLPKIGEEFGGRDHTTVIHACDKISKNIENDSKLASNIEEMLEEIKN